MFQNPPPEAIKALLANAKAVAVVGIPPRGVTIVMDRCISVEYRKTLG